MNQGDAIFAREDSSKGSNFPSKRRSASIDSVSLLDGSNEMKPSSALIHSIDAEEEEGGADVHLHTFGRAQSSQSNLMLTFQSSTDKSDSIQAGQCVPLKLKQKESSSQSFSPNDFDMAEVYTTSLAPRVHDRKRRSLSRTEGDSFSGANLEESYLSVGDVSLEQQRYHQRLSSSFEEARRLSGDSQRRYRGIERALEAQDQGILSIRIRTVSEPITSFALPSDKITAEDKKVGQRLQFNDSLEKRDASALPPVQHRPVSLSAPTEPSRHGNHRLSAGARSSGMASSSMMPWAPTPSSAISLQDMSTSQHLQHDNNAQHTQLAMTTHDTLSQQRLATSYHLGALHAMRAKLPSDTSNDLKHLRYTSWLPRLHRILLPLITYAHVFATIFLDYNTIYTIVQVALYPDASGEGTAWWIAIGIYSASLITWLIGIVVIWEIIIQYHRRRRYANALALPIYLSSSTFDLASIQSASIYSLLHRVRYAANRRDFIIETFWFYSQNWPTVLTLLPRGIIIAVFLVLYNPITPSAESAVSTQARDSVYFDPSSGLLSTFAFIVLTLNAAWIAWRISILLLSYLGLCVALGPKALIENGRTCYDWTQNDEVIAIAPEERPPRNQAAKSHDNTDPSIDLLTTAMNEMPPDSVLQVTGKGRHDLKAVSMPSPSWAWRARAEERLRMLLLASNEGSDQEIARLNEGQVKGEETELYLISGHNEDRVEDHIELEKGVIISAEEKQRIASGRGSSSFDRLRDIPRLVLPGDVSILTSIQSSSTSQGQAGKMNSKGKEREKGSDIHDLSDAFTSRRGTFVSHERPTSDISISSILSTSTARPIPLYSSISSNQEAGMHPFPSNVGEVTPTLGSFAHAMQRVQSSSPRPTATDAFAASSGDIILPDIPVKKRRASSSLPSLSESLRFGRGNRSTDSIRQDNDGTSASKVGRSWWSGLTKGKSRDMPFEPDKDEGEEKVEDLKAEGDVEEGEAGIPLGSEQNSLRTHTTTTTEDSEEKRLWSQFPEQSRRYPPGLIALELEQRRMTQEVERRHSSGNTREDSALIEELDEHREVESATRRSGESLVPITEESWSNSLDGVSNESR